MSGTPTFEAVLARLRAEYSARAEADFDLAVQMVASPIEKVFAAQLVTQWGWLQCHQLPFSTSMVVDEMLTAAGIVLPEDAGERVELLTMGTVGEHVACIAQGTIHLAERNIRPDFAFVLQAPDREHRHADTKIVVELDGHDFHERTPEQAQRDKSRDRELQSRGWQVLRYTGREVLRDPAKCVRETLTLLHAKWSLAQQQVRT